MESPLFKSSSTGKSALNKENAVVQSIADNTLHCSIYTTMKPVLAFRKPFCELKLKWMLKHVLALVPLLHAFLPSLVRLSAQHGLLTCG
jgi:hypothetical protein